MDKTLKMIYNLPNGKTFSTSLKAPKDDLTRTAVADAMSDAITKEVFTVGGAHPISTKEMYITGSTRIELV